MELLDLFKIYLLNQKRPASRVTVKNYSSDIRHFIKWFEESYRQSFIPQAVSVVVAARYKEYLSSLSPRTCVRHLSTLRNFFKFLKDQGVVESSPFELQTKLDTEPPQDPWQKKEFKDYLYSNGASHLTIKNYIIDVQGFTKWLEETLEDTSFSRLTPQVIIEYRERLLAVKKFSPRSVNRKLSSIRKYLAFAKEKGLIEEIEVLPEFKTAIKTPKKISLEEIDSAKNEGYSFVPPVRLIQRLFRPYEIFEDKIAATIAEKIRKKQVKETREDTSNKYEKVLSQIRNIKKEFYAPHSISLENYPLHKKAYHHLKHTRPNWYKTYHSFSFVNYLHFGVLIIFASGVGFMLFQELFTNPNTKGNAFAHSPARVLSFQGKLTDTNDLPITTPTDIRFAIYGQTTGGTSLWSESHSQVTPGSNGVFSVSLGETVGIPQTVFTDNSELFLGIAVNDTEELTPRQRLATVSFAANSESLQGMLPITDAAAGTSNVILALDSTGNLTMGGTANPTFQATGGQFKLSGQPLTLMTNSSSNGNIQLVPDGTGKVDLQKELVNTGNSGGISPGAVEVNDKFAVIATESAVAAFILNNNSTGGDIFAASSSGTTRFLIENDGTLKFKKYTTDGGLLFANTKGQIYQTGTGSSSQCLIGGTTPIWGSCNAGISDLWSQGTGNIYGANTTQDFVLGGTATISAKFSVVNIATGTPTASISATSTGTGLSLGADGTIQSLLSSNLTIGGNTTGNIILNPNNGIGSVGIGTSSPTGVLNINGTSVGKALAVLNETGGNEIFTASSSGTTRFTIANNGNITATGSISGLTGIDSSGTITLSGQVGIGATTPLARLDVRALNATSPAASISGQTNTASLFVDNTTGDLITASSAGMARFVIKNDGSTGIGTATPGAMLQVGDQGDGTVARANSWDVFSDFRFKDNINPISDSLNKVLALKGVSFNWRNSGNKSIGFIAQEVEKIIPEIVTTDSRGYKSLDYGKITPLLVNAIQEQETKLSTLNSQLSTLTSGLISIPTLVANSLDITTDSITVAGISLKDYIAQTLNSQLSLRWGAGQAIFNSPLSTSKIVSPLAEIDRIHTNIISPLAEDSQISIKLEDSRLTIYNSKDASGSAVATIDASGSAEFNNLTIKQRSQLTDASVSGQLAVNNLSANSATVSGTLFAERIIANQIDGLDERIASIASEFSNQNQTNNISTGSSELSLDLSTFNSPFAGAQGKQFSTSFVDISTLSASFATFRDGLIAFGPTTLDQVSVLDSISIGTNFIINSNSINFLGGELEIQPLRQGGVSFLGGAVRIDTDGNLKVNENAEFAKDVLVKGNLSANIISPLPGHDLTVSIPDSKFKVQDSEERDVLSINQTGDLTASGSGTFGKINLSLSSPAYALNDTQAVATGSAGTAIIKKYRTEITILNPLVTEKSLIYITPVGNATSVISLLRQSPNSSFSQGSFTVGANSIAPQDIQFNWIIVN